MDSKFSAQDMELWDALSRGHEDRASLLLDSGVSTSSKDPYGQTLLQYACRFGCARVIEKLLDLGAPYPPPGSCRCLLQDVVSSQDISPSLVRRLTVKAYSTGWSLDDTVDCIMKNPQQMERMGFGYMLSVGQAGKGKPYIPLHDHNRVRGAIMLSLSCPPATASPSRRF